MEKNFSKDNLKVEVLKDRAEIGKRSAGHVSSIIKELLKTKNEVRMVFAAAPSQNEFLGELTKDKSIDWQRIVAFHMDEYIGLPAGSEFLFGKYLSDNIFSKVNFKAVHLIHSQAKDMNEECRRYAKLLAENPVDIVCMGIGENGHIAFNDPPVADFKDPFIIKIVELEEKCKLQQVNDAGFKSIDEVPARAVTLTVPALMTANFLSVVVPGIRKAEAVKNTLEDSISEKCPATILRTHKNAVLFVDDAAASLL